MIRRVTSTAVAAFATTVVVPAVAVAEPKVGVEAAGCEDLDTAELATLLDLELSEMVGSWEDIEAPPVELECGADQIVIAVEDPITSKRLSRAIPRPDGPMRGRERALALAISQLFVTSWLELLVPAERRGFTVDALPPEEVQAATERAREEIAPEPEAAPPTATSPEPEGELALTLAASGGVRARDLSQPMATVVGSARGGLSLAGRFGVFAEAGLEHGTATRDRGEVDVWIAAFGVGASWLSSPEDVALTANATLSALYVRLSGKPNDPLVVGGTTQSAAAQLALEVGPALTLDPLRLELLGAGGVTLFAPEGAVSQESAVRPGGAFIGVTLHAGLEFR